MCREGTTIVRLNQCGKFLNLLGVGGREGGREG